MGADVAAVSIVSVFWVVVGAVVPWFIRKGSQRTLIQAIIVTTSICCYLFWLCTYMSQMYPLVGPTLSNSTVMLMEEYWSHNKSAAA
ncbi:V-type proton ATPase subunit e 1-like [Haemaphysalis longicornis]